MTDSGSILVINAGSSSIKAAVFDGSLSEQVRGEASGIGGAGKIRIGKQDRTLALPDHAAALRALMEALSDHGVALTDLRAVGHRVVHGGTALTAPHLVTPAVRDRIAACIPLAPLHNPHNLAAIDAIADLAPDLPQCASFDTAFHATNEPVAARYAIPPETEARGIRRYGFHGISYAALVETLPEISETPLPKRIVAFHLGNGASICAIRDGKSIATSMGYSPLEGLTMGTRSGNIDANAVLRLAEEDGIEATRRLLNRQSGLRGLSGGISDMRQLLEAGTPEAEFAVSHFCYWAIRHAGSLIAAMGGVDTFVFTGGIGENAAPVRSRIAAGFGWLRLTLDEDANNAGSARLHDVGSALQCWIVPAREERMIAADAARILDTP